MGGWKVAVGVTVGVFAAGVAVGVVAHRRGIPEDQVGRWLVKGVIRRGLRVADGLREHLAVGEALGESPP